MANVINPFFEQYATPQFFPGLVDIVGTCRLDIEGMESWMVTINKGELSITKSSSNAKADTVITGSEQDFVRMIQKQENPLTAFLSGRISVRGDISLAEISSRIFRMEPTNTPQREKGRNDE